MSTHRTVLVAVVLAGTTAAIACGGSGSPELVFKVPVARIPRSMQRAYRDLSPGDSVELRLPGEWFETPLELTVITREAADFSSALSASQAAYSAFKHYDDAWIVASFAEDDREDIRRFLADSAVRAGSRRYYEGIQDKRIHGWARYAQDSTEYRLVFVSLTHASLSERLETFVLEAGEWRRTNRLAKERDFQIAWNAYRYGRVTPQ